MLRPLLCIAALAPTTLVAAKPPLVRATVTDWPGPNGTRLHGLIALPAKARGRQRAVVVLGDAARPEIAQLVEAIAGGGFIACAIRGPRPAGSVEATIAWLGAHRYTTGRIGIVSAALDDPAAVALVLHPPDHLAAAVLPDPPPMIADAPIPLLRLADHATIGPADLPAVLAFLKEQLR